MAWKGNLTPLDLAARGTKGANFAVVAIRFAGEAPAAAMPDKPMAEQGPLHARDELDQVLFDLLRSFLARESKALGEARHVRVYDYPAIDVEGIAEDDIGRLAPDPIQGGQFFHGAGHLAMMAVHQFLTGGFNVLGFVSEKAQALNRALQLIDIRIREVFRGLVGLE